MVPQTLSLAADLYGYPNRCLHCWLGHRPNRRMEEGADRFIVDCFAPHFERIAVYSWFREPDFCDGYEERWERDIALSKNARPERFELASFWRIVRDERYIPFLRRVGVRKVQLTLFGLRETQDRYVGRKGAFDEVLRATDLLAVGGITPRWQCFINEENRAEIPEVRRLWLERKEKYPEMEFFVHEGSCEGENRRLYPIRIRKEHIPEELIPDYLGYATLLTERECCALLREDRSALSFPVGDELVLNVTAGYDVFTNLTEMSGPWVVGNLKRDDPAEIVRRAVTGDTPALRALARHSWAELADRLGDSVSGRAFGLNDYRMYLVNEFFERFPS